MHILIVKILFALTLLVTPSTPTPPPPPPCKCVQYQIFLPVIVRSHDTVCWANGLYCDWLIRDSDYVFHLTDEGLYNEVSLSRGISINDVAYLFVESDSGEALPPVNEGYTMIWFYMDGYYYYSTWEVLAPQILKVK
jgi:hypothetical protein